MQKSRLSLEDFSLSEIHTKFGVCYRDAELKRNNVKFKLPVFLELHELNKALFGILNECASNNDVVIKIVYSDKAFCSLNVNGIYAVNYSMGRQSIIPASFLLKSKGVRMVDVKKSLSKAGNGYKLIKNTFTACKDGVRVEAINKLGDKITLRVGKRIKYCK